MHVSVAVLPEHKLVEAALHVALAEAIKSALSPSLEVREDAVGPVQLVVRLPTSDGADLVSLRRRVFLSEPAVGDDLRPGFDGSTDEAMPGVPKPVPDVRKPECNGANCSTMGPRVVGGTRIWLFRTI